MSDPHKADLESKEVMNIFREIKKRPELTQRELSSHLGISLGKVNFLLKALIKKGHIRVRNFKNSNNKYAYIYNITPRGLEEKARITYNFLRRKLKEYEELEGEIQRLEEEVDDIHIPDKIRD